MNERRRLFADWRDFGREYVIVVLGVLTALLAQSAVEDWSWNAKVRAATQDMDQEMGNGNGPQAVARLAVHRCQADRLALLRQAVEDGDRATARKVIDTIRLSPRTYNSFARQAADASDIKAHMAPAESNEYRILYSLTPERDSIHREELLALADLRALPAVGGPLDQEERRFTLAAVERLAQFNERGRRAAAFTLRHMRTLKIGLAREQIRRNLLDYPGYGACVTRDVTPMIDDSPPTYPGITRS